MKFTALKSLSRTELLELLAQQKKHSEAVEAQLAEANRKLESKEILLRESGSIAEAALRLSDIFEVAQKAADAYSENVNRLADEALQKAKQEADALQESATVSVRNTVTYAVREMNNIINQLEIKGKDCSEIKRMASELVRRYQM